MFVTEAIVVVVDDKPIINLTVVGVPEAQARMRARRVRNRVIMFDPSAPSKRKCQKSIADALSEVGVATQPIFVREKVALNIVFHVTNIRKDVDNMLKYILDVLQGVVYHNDAAVFKVTAAKIHCRNKKDQKTTMEIESF